MDDRRAPSCVFIQIVSKFTSQVLGICGRKVRYLYRSRHKECLACYFRYRSDWHGSEMTTVLRDRSDENNVPIASLRTRSSYRSRPHSCRRNKAASTMIKEHEVSRLDVVNEALCIPKCSNTGVIHHVPYRILVIALIRVEQHALHVSRIYVSIVRTGKKLEIQFARQLIDSVGEKIDGDPLAPPVVDGAYQPSSAALPITIRCCRLFTSFGSRATSSANAS